MPYTSLYLFIAIDRYKTVSKVLAIHTLDIIQLDIYMAHPPFLETVTDEACWGISSVSLIRGVDFTVNEKGLKVSVTVMLNQTSNPIIISQLNGVHSDSLYQLWIQSLLECINCFLFSRAGWMIVTWWSGKFWTRRKGVADKLPGFKISYLKWQLSSYDYVLFQSKLMLTKAAHRHVIPFCLHPFEQPVGTNLHPAASKMDSPCDPDHVVSVVCTSAGDLKIAFR